jgi:hypothetical protein
LPVLAEAALRNLFIDPGLLDRMELTVFGDPLKGCDLALHTRSGCDARPCGDSINDHCARTALAEPATKPRTSQAEIITQYVEQRSRRIDIQGVRFTVHLQRDVAHYNVLLKLGLQRADCILLPVKNESAEAQLAGFMAKYNPEIAALASAARKKMQKRLPGAFELVYDNYNALVIGYGPTDRASDAIFSIVLYPRWVTLFFLNGKGLPDPEKLLKGGGVQVRRVVLEDAAMLDSPAIQSLIKAALERSSKQLNAKARSQLMIKSISARQRPRRPSPLR